MSSPTPTAPTVPDIESAIASVDDPEFPGISIVELGLVERVSAGGDHVEVTLIPTFPGCPALEQIRADVTAAVHALPGVQAVTVAFANTPVWTPSRISERGRRLMAERFTVSVEHDGRSTCPRCGADTSETSMFGPTRCRSVHRCPSCTEIVEVVRR